VNVASGGPTHEPGLLTERWCQAVTRAGCGIGRAIALELAGAGAHADCVDQVPGHAKATATEILAAGSRAVPVVADVTDPAAMAAAVTRIESALGPLTLGVNAAGIASAAPAESMPEEQWRQVINVDLSGVFLSCQAEGRAMIIIARRTRIDHVCPSVRSAEAADLLIDRPPRRTGSATTSPGTRFPHHEVDCASPPRHVTRSDERLWAAH